METICIIETTKQNIRNGLKLIAAMEKHYEIWEPIDGYDYEVSNFGQVRNSECYIINSRMSNSGYRYIRLYKMGEVATLYIHRLVCAAFQKNTYNKKVVDHINGNKLDNNNCNLRWVSYSENGLNRNKESNNISGIRGISFNKNVNSWYVRLTVSGKPKNLGYFKSLDDAILFRNAEAKKYYGEFYRNDM